MTKLRILTAALCAVLSLPSALLAQEATVVGTITDSTDAVLPGVTVTALKLDNGNTFVDVSDGSGNYRLPLRSGVYKITAELTGFTPVVRDNVELQVGSRTVLNLRLTLSTVTESVTVTGETPMVDVSQSKLGGNIDRRQVEELPVNGRNFLDLSMLAPGSRANSVAESPLERADTGGGGAAQLNVDGQQVTDMVSSTGFGQPRYSKDAVAEFEMISNRFDATQGHASMVQVNVVTKSGTNQYQGSVSGFFRSDKFNAADFIVKRVLPYSDQQVSTTFGGPIKKDKLHFFANYEYERNPQTFIFTTPYPLFNKEDLKGDQVLFTSGIKLDVQVSPQSHVMFRGYRYHNDLPYDPRNTGGGSQTISAAATTERSSDSLFTSIAQTFGSKAVNEVKVGYNSFFFASDGIVPGTPRINLLNLTMGKPQNYPQDLREIRYSLRDDLTVLFSLGGRHEMKVGGEYLHNNTNVFWWQNGDGTLTANNGPVPANIEQLFPNQYDPRTWNMAGLSRVSVRWNQSFGEHTFDNPVQVYSTWAQDNWTITPRLTANLGVRYEVSPDALGEEWVLLPFMPPDRHAALTNIVPRLGAAYNFNDGKTVIRGGGGKFIAQPHDGTNYNPGISVLTATPSTNNDGRPNFAADPYNGRTPTIAQAFATLRDLTGSLVSPDIKLPFSYQSSIGVQHQLNTTMSFQADYVYTASRRELNNRNQNLSYNPVTGVNNPYTIVALRPFPNWGLVSTQYSDGLSNYHGLQTAFNKRFSNRWQATATYTMSGLWDMTPCPVTGLACPKDLGGDYTLGATDQRHRAVFNGIWALPYDFQLSGLYFFGSGLRRATSFGGDRRLQGVGGSGRLAANGTIVPRNSFVGKPLHRVDIRILKRLNLVRAKIDGILEVFNLFNHENYGSYVTTTGSANYGQPQQNIAVAYQPRIMQLGFRFTF